MPSPDLRRSTSSNGGSAGRPGASLPLPSWGWARTSSQPTQGSTRSSSGSRASWHASRPPASSSSSAGARPTPSRSTGHARPGWCGFEFACAIPGTAGGGVRMNAGAYGSDWSSDRSSCAGRDRRGNRLARSRRARSRVPPLGASPRSGGRAGRIRARAPTRVGDQGAGRRSHGAAQGDATDESSDVRVGVQEPSGGAGRRAVARALWPQGAPHRWCRDLTAARELHRERRRCDERRLSRADAGGSPTRAGGARRGARARGRRCSARSRWGQGTRAGGVVRRRRSTPWPVGDESTLSSVPAHARPASSSRSRERPRWPARARAPHPVCAKLLLRARSRSWRSACSRSRGRRRSSRCGRSRSSVRRVGSTVR